jgi:hypothetical protein
MLVQLPNGDDGLPTDVGVLKYHGIRGSKLALDALVSGFFGVSSPPSPEVALRRAEKSKFEKYSEGVEESKSPRHRPLHPLFGHIIWYSRRPRHSFFGRGGQANTRL